MKSLDTKLIVFNAAAAIITIGALVAVLRSYVFAPSAAPCAERYANGTLFALDRAGVVLTAADLQSSLAGNDAGVLENLSIGRLADAPAAIVLNVSLPKGSGSPLNAALPKGGVSFPWQPRTVQGKTAACLSYSVFLPADFEFHRGGVLPGIRGADLSGQSEDGFLARPAWRPDRKGGATLRLSTGEKTQGSPVERESFSFPRGRWVKLELEVVLNTPKEADGILRAWVDGKLAIERTDTSYRAKPGVGIAGVSADVFYGAEDASITAAAPKDTKVSLSPFELRWQ
jgi:polysaccharide lyase-like protein